MARRKVTPARITDEGAWFAAGCPGGPKDGPPARSALFGQGWIGEGATVHRGSEPSPEYVGCTVRTLDYASRKDDPRTRAQRLVAETARYPIGSQRATGRRP